MYSTVDYLIEVNNIIAGSHKVILRKFNVNSYGFDEMYMDKKLIDQYQIANQFNKRQITPTKFFSILFNKIQDGSRITCKICLLMMIKKMKLIDEKISIETIKLNQ